MYLIPLAAAAAGYVVGRMTAPKKTTTGYGSMSYALAPMVAPVEESMLSRYVKPRTGGLMSCRRAY
jgi:hypothetical protein